MELRDVLAKRRSVRKFEDIPVPDEMVQEILVLARRAPSAGNLKGYQVIISREPVVSVRAPVYLIICARPDTYTARYGNRGRDLYAVQDATILASYIQLIAVDMGLATVWVGAFREGKVRRMLKLPDSSRPIVVLPLGYEKEAALLEDYPIPAKQVAVVEGPPRPLSIKVDHQPLASQFCVGAGILPLQFGDTFSTDDGSDGRREIHRGWSGADR